MTSRSIIALWLACCGLLATSQPACAAEASGAAPSSSAASDLRAGRAFVAVLIDGTDKRLLASEAYADWHAYYTQFAEHGHGQTPVYTLSPERGRALFARLSRTTGNASLFVNACGQALLHDGLVLEPQVYDIGRAFAEGAAITPQAKAYGLTPLSLR